MQEHTHNTLIFMEDSVLGPETVSVTYSNVQVKRNWICSALEIYWIQIVAVGLILLEQ